jgi:hypothetical protein
MAKIPRLYRWAGWLLAASGAGAALLAGYFHGRVEQAVVEERTLGEDAGLAEEQLRERIAAVQAQIAEGLSWQVGDQVQALALLTRLAGRHALLPELQFARQGGELRCRLKVGGPQESIWGLLAGIDALHERSRGTVGLRAYRLNAADDGRIDLNLELALIIRSRGGTR